MTNVTESVSTHLKVDEIQKALSFLCAKTEQKEKTIVYLYINLTDKQYAKVFRFPPLEKWKGHIGGLPILKKNFVPVGELWFVDSHGRPLKKFKV